MDFYLKTFMCYQIFVELQCLLIMYITEHIILSYVIERVCVRYQKKRKNDPFATNLRCFYGTIHNVDVMTSPTNLSVAVIVLSVTRKHEYHLAQRTY